MLTKEILDSYGFERFDPTDGFPWNVGETEVYMNWYGQIGIDLLNKKAFKATLNAPDAFPYARPSVIETFYHYPENEDQLKSLWFAVYGSELKKYI